MKVGEEITLESGTILFRTAAMYRHGDRVGKIVTTKNIQARIESIHSDKLFIRADLNNVGTFYFLCYITY